MAELTYLETCNITMNSINVSAIGTSTYEFGLRMQSLCHVDLARLEVTFGETHNDVRQTVDLIYGFNFANNQMQYESNWPFRRYLVNNPIHLAIFFIALFAILCNVICLAVMFRITMTLSGHRLFIMSLCFSDSVISTMYLLYLYRAYLADVKIVSPLDINYCKDDMIATFLYSGYLLSLSNLIGMAIDHFVGILRPLYYCRWLSTRNTTVAIILIWILGPLLGAGPLIFALFAATASGTSLRAFCHTPAKFGYYYYPTILLVATPIAFVIIFFCYLRIFRKIGDLHRRTPRLLSQIEIRKATITTLLIVVTFAICWMPWVAVELYQFIYLKLVKPDYSEVNWKANKVAGRVSVVLLIFNALADPLIYTFRMAQFRNRMAHVLCLEALRQRLRRSRLSFSGPVNHRLLGHSGNGGGDSRADGKLTHGPLKPSHTMPNSLFGAPASAMICSVEAIVSPRRVNGSMSIATPPNTLTTTTSCSGMAMSGNQSVSTIGCFLNAGLNSSRSGSGQSDRLPVATMNDENNRLLENVTGEEQNGQDEADPDQNDVFASVANSRSHSLEIISEQKTAADEQKTNNTAPPLDQSKVGEQNCSTI